jgi:hypothetical protein
LDLNNPGIYEVKIQVGDKTYQSSLKVVDTIAPIAKAADQILLKNDQIEAQRFVTELSDSTQVNVSYEKTPDFSTIGDQEVSIVLTDAGNNQTALKAKLTILNINKSVTIEAGSSMNITADDFKNDESYAVTIETDLNKLDISKAATHEIELNVDDKTVTAYIEVVDTTPPNAVVGNQQIWLGETPEAITFVADMAGETGLTASYKEAPDFTLTGDQSVVIVLSDESGNTIEQTVTMSVQADTEPPVLSGVADKTVYIGQTVSYKKGVAVTDNKDEKVDFQVDNSKVNLKKAGSYPLTYTATDASGNKATASVTITVMESIISFEELTQMAQSILDQIVTEDMTQEEKAFEIYKWTRNHIAYTGHSDKSDWVAEAYRGIENAVGDCFTYFAVSQALLNQADIENMGVTRLGGKTRHYWSLVNVGNGWYHFDSCPNKDHKESFMMTESEIDEFTLSRGNNYYTYDKSLYSVTPVQ